MTLFKAPPATLCVLRLSAIGDVCNAIAAVQAIQAHWPNTQITWIAGKAEACLLTPLLPEVKVIAFDKKQGIKGMLSVWRSLNGQKFDALLHMQTALRASFLSLGIKARYRLGFDKDRAYDLQSFFTNTKVKSPLSSHVLDGFMAFAYALGVPKTTPSWQLAIPLAQRKWAKEQLRQKPLMILAPSASKNYKNWTLEGYVGILEHACETGFDLLLVGGKSENEIALGQAIENHTKAPLRNFIGKTSLIELMALICEAKLVIAPDSGPAHIANALNTPVIGLYAHHNPKRTGPYRFLRYVVNEYDNALWQECHKTPAQVAWRTRVKNNNAMEAITLDAVINKFERLIKEEGIKTQ